MLGQLGKANVHEKPCHQDDADGLAKHGAKVDALGDRVRDDGGKVHVHNPHLRVHKREDGQDHKVHRHRDVALHALQRRRDVVHHALHTHRGGGEIVLAQDVALLVIRVVQLAGAGVKPVAQLGEAHIRARGQEERQDDAGQRGVDARVVHAHPQHQANQHVGLGRVDFHARDDPQHHNHAERRGAPGHVGGLPVEEGDDHDGQDVVGDGQGLEEDLGRGGNAVTEKRHDAQRKGDVGGDGGGPAVHGTTGVEDEVDHRRCRHAANCGEHGKRGLPGLSQLPHGHLVLELYAHQQEEDGHEEVVHKGLDGYRKGRGANAQREGRVEHLLNHLVGGRVGRDDRRDGSEHHDRSGYGAVGGHLVDSAALLDAPDDCGLTVDACHWLCCPFP